MIKIIFVLYIEAVSDLLQRFYTDDRLGSTPPARMMRCQSATFLCMLVVISSHMPVINAETPWQAPLLACAGKCSSLASSWAPLLAADGGAANWPTTAAAGGGARFLLLPRLLKPKEANIQFAAAFCAARGGTLAHWESQAQAGALAFAALSLQSRIGGGPIHFYIGLAQEPGAAEPRGGWRWLSSSAPLSTSWPFWGAKEPNEHNGGNVAGHSEDCAVMATYHGARAAPRLVDDFPCVYSDPRSNHTKFVAGGHNPRLSVACRMP